MGNSRFPKTTPEVVSTSDRTAFTSLTVFNVWAHEKFRTAATGQPADGILLFLSLLQTWVHRARDSVHQRFGAEGFAQERCGTQPTRLDLDLGIVRAAHGDHWNGPGLPRQPALQFLTAEANELHIQDQTAG